MSTQLGKKYIVIPNDTYQMLLSKKETSYQPEKEEVLKSEQEMKDVWNTSIPPHEKVKMFTEELSKFKTLVNTLSQPLKVEVTDQKSTHDSKISSEKTDGKKPDFIDNSDSFIKNLPKLDRKKGKSILDFLKMHPEKISWNENNEMIYEGKTYHGSKMSDLLADVVTKRKKPISHSFHRGAFLKALADIDVPTDMIKNEKHSQMLEAYKNEPYELKTESPVKKKKKETNWLSSTSSRR